MAPIETVTARQPGRPADPRITTASKFEPPLTITSRATYPAADPRTIPCLLATGMLLPHDLRIRTDRRGSPRWKLETTRGWIEQGGRP
jgi:hypothetical protein